MWRWQFGVLAGGLGCWQTHRRWSGNRRAVDFGVRSNACCLVGSATGFEDAHDLCEAVRFVSQAFCCRRALLHQSCILLRHLIQLVDGSVHLSYAAALFTGCRRDFPNHVCHPLNAGHDFSHGFACVLHQLAATLHFFDAGVDEVFDFLGCLCTAPRQISHFTCHHCKAPAGFTCTRSFHCRIQRQDVGLKRDAVNHTNDVCNFSAAVVDVFHGGDHLVDHSPTL